MRLSLRTVSRSEPQPGRDYVVWDDQVKGFGLRVKASGAKSYIIQYRTLERRSRRLTVGKHGVLTPDEARKRARALLGQVAAGIDPAERTDDRLTIKELRARYLSEHARPKKKASSVEKDEQLLRLYIVPAIGARSVVGLSRADVARLHHKLRRTPITANRVLALVSKMMNLSERWGLRPDGSNPCRHVERYPERKRERFLSMAELERLGKALAEAEGVGDASSLACDAIKLLIFTGCRLSEIVNLRWRHVNWDLSLLLLPDSKTGKKAIPLNAPALQLLDRLHRCDPSEFVFPSRGKTGHLINVQTPWEEIRKRAELEDVRLHDLRHSFASVGAGIGLGLPIIGKLLGHRVAATTARYAHLADDPLRQATEAIGSEIEAAMAEKSIAEVQRIGGGG